MQDLLLLAHPSVGMLGVLAALWLLVEALHVGPANVGRIRVAACIVALAMVLAWVLGGAWYVSFYKPEKALILAGPWPWAHGVVMEVKEHLFFALLILSLYLPLVARGALVGNHGARRLLVTVSALIVLLGMAMEAGGALVNYGVKLALLASSGGAP